MAAHMSDLIAVLDYVGGAVGGADGALDGRLRRGAPRRTDPERAEGLVLLDAGLPFRPKNPDETLEAAVTCASRK